MPIYTIQMNVFEAGRLMGLIESAGERAMPALSGVRKQLIVMKEDLEKDAGVVKKILPNGMLEISDKDGTRITRPPYSWEIKGD